MRLYDAVPDRAGEAADAIARLDRLVEGLPTNAERSAARARLTAARPSTSSPAARSSSRRSWSGWTSNRSCSGRWRTSSATTLPARHQHLPSLSVTAIGGALRVPGRVIGMHFFNPAPVMRLVEVVYGFGDRTPQVGHRVACGARRVHGARSPSAVADTPGVSWSTEGQAVLRRGASRCYEDRGRRCLPPSTRCCVRRGGFRMGPLELTDLIGQDVNQAVTRSVWEAFFGRLAGSPPPWPSAAWSSPAGSAAKAVRAGTATARAPSAPSRTPPDRARRPPTSSCRGTRARRRCWSR